MRKIMTSLEVLFAKYDNKFFVKRFIMPQLTAHYVLSYLYRHYTPNPNHSYWEDRFPITVIGKTKA